VTKLILGQVLKQRRLSKRQFAKRLDIEYNNVFRYFRNGYDPKLSSLAKWAKAIGCKVRDLIEE
jgi:transcriptional regulator with XRE-family HTH domain